MIDVTVKYYNPQNYKSSGRVVNFQILVADRLKYKRIWSLHITVTWDTECWMPLQLQEPAGEPRRGWVAQGRGLAEPGGPEGGRVRGVGGVVAAQVGAVGRGQAAPRPLARWTPAHRGLWFIPRNCDVRIWERQILNVVFIDYLKMSPFVSYFLTSCYAVSQSHATYFDFVLFLAGWIQAINFHNARKINKIDLYCCF